jgi:hypothetical protein
MKANLKNYLLLGRFFLLGVIGAGLLTACSDDDDPEPDPVALVTPSKASDAVATPTSLTFSWQSVANAGSYSYVLKDASGTTLESGTTVNTSIYFSGLAAKSTYTLEVTAVPSDTTSYLNSATLTLTGTTTDYNQLATPTQAAEPVAELDAIKFSWNAVDGASEYAYTLKDAAGTTVASGTTQEVNLYITNLAEGTTYTLTVTAKPAASDSKESGELSITATTLAHVTLAAPQVSAEVAARTVVTWNAVDNAEAYVVSYESVVDTLTTTSLTLDFLTLDQATTISVVAINQSDELYLDSEAGTVTATRTRSEVERVEGIYYYNPSASTRTIISYSDGSYVIPAWYGVEGYDFEFMVNEDGSILPNAWYESNWYWLATGVDDNGCWFFVNDGYGAFEGNLTYGDIWFWDNAANGYYYYVWHHYNGTWTKPDGSVVETYVQDNYDGSYTIKNWYGNEGYDFNFTLGEDNEIVPSSDYYFTDNCYWVWYGPGDNDGAWIYTTGGSSAWDETGIWFWDYASYSYYWLKFDTEE